VGLYQVTCASVSACPEDSTQSHIESLGLNGPEGSKTLDVSVARLMLSSGDTLSLGARGDDDAELRKGRCPACGVGTLRTRKRDSGNAMSDLAPC
jgi:hypothetical protein